MPQQVKAFGQILQFPDGMSEDEMAAAIRANEADLNPDYKAPLKDTLNSLAKKHLGVDFTSTPSIADQAEASATEGENTAARQVPGAPVRQSTYNKALLDPQQSAGGTDITSRISDAAANDFKGQANQQELELLRTEALKPSESVPDGLSGLAANVITGAKQTGRMIDATINAAMGDRSRVEDIAKASAESAEINTPGEQKALLGELNLIDKEQGAFGQIGDTLKSAANNPMGTGQLVAEQLPNTAVSLGAGYTGFKTGAAAGSLIGPVGVAVGGALGFVGGMFLGNVLLEAGAKAIEKASDEDGFSPQDRDESLREGAIKAGVITGVDAATLKLGGMLAKRFGSAAIKAGARAEAKVLIEAGVNATSLTAINAALKASPELFNAARTAGERAVLSTLSAGNKAAIVGTGVALETVGEFAGEAAGEYAATGKVDYVDATIEALSSATMSVAETAYNYNKVASGNDLSPEGIRKAASSINDADTKAGVADIQKASNIDEAIKAANDTVSNKPVTTDDILRTVDPTLEDIKTTVDTRQPQASEVLDVVLPDNSSVKVQWAVVDADQLAASIKEDVNQPRDRTRAVSDVQIKSIANAPDYRRLSDSPVMDVGAPVVDLDGRIVAGNGRFAGLSQAYEQGTATEYLNQLREDAARKGLSIEGIAKPVLIRQLVEPVDARKLAIASNSGTTLQMSALEQAKLDSERMKGIENLDVNDLGDIALTPRNMTQLKDSLGTYTNTELGALVDKGGQLSQEGMRRVRNAMLAKAYGSSPVLERLVESTDSDMRNVLGALTRSANHIIKTKGDVKPLMEAVDTYAQLKATGQPVDNFLAQQDAFSDGLSKEAEDILRFIDTNVRSQKKLTDFIKGNFREVDTTSADMFEAPARHPNAKAASKDASWVIKNKDTGEILFETFDKAKVDALNTSKYEAVPIYEYLTGLNNVNQLEKYLKDSGYAFTVEPTSVRDVDALDSTKKARKEHAEKVAKFFKKKVVFVKADGPFRINGVMVPSITDTIFIDIRTDKPFDAIMAHELSHWMEQEKPAVYKQMVKSLKKVINEDATGKYAKKYGIDGATDAELTKEIVGDIMGDNFTQQSFWDKVAAANPEAFKDIAAAIIKWLKGVIVKAKANGMGSEEWLKDATKAQDVVAKAVAQYTESDAASVNVESKPKFNADKKTVTVDGVERPTENSLRMKIHPTEEGIRKFWRWFGDSKVVDYQGRPKVVYHGSSKAGFSVFDTSAGAFFHETYSVAAGYGGTFDEVDFDNNGERSPGLYEVYLKLENPLFIDFEGNNNANGPDGLVLVELVNQARYRGHDGVIAEQVEDIADTNFADKESSVGTVYVALAPNQIKSATDNGGQFSDADNDILFSRAYHGSPHDHDKFDKSKIGTGEGAQAYGYGHYFTDTKEVAEYYKKALSTKSVMIDNTLYTTDDSGMYRDGNGKLFKPSNIGEELAIRGLLYGATRTSDLNTLAEEVESFLQTRSGISTESIDKAKNFIKSGRLQIVDAGRLYEVELAPEQDEYLLWDKPLSEQSDKVKVALKGLGINSNKDPDAMSDLELKGALGGFENTLGKGEATGAKVYKELASHFNSDKKASEYLHSLGIRGIKYLDGSSRAKGEGAYNYVIFDDNDISITAKFSRVDKDYRMEHQSPGREGNAPLSDLTGDGNIYPEDVYSNKAVQYYGTGDDVMDKQSFVKAKSYRGKPDAIVEVYRAVPKGVSDTINPGDWVTINRNYAKEHGESYFDGNYDILSKKVKAGDIFTNGDSIHEWGYAPEDNIKLSKQEKLPGTINIDGTERTTRNSEGKLIHPTEEGIRSFWKWFGDSKVVDEQGRPLVVYHGTTYGDILEFKPNGGDAILSNATLKSFKNAVANNEPFGLMNFRSGSFFSPDIKYAENYTRENTGAVYPVYIKSENPGYFQQDRNIEPRWSGFDKNKTADSLMFVEGSAINEIAVIDPNQIKSAIGNNGQFSKTNDDIRFSRAPKLYSKLEQALEAANDKVFSTGPQVKLWLQSNASKLGIKKDEIYWSGIDNWLDAQGKVSKQQVVEFVRNNGVKVEDVTLGDMAKAFNKSSPYYKLKKVVKLIEQSRDPVVELENNYEAYQELSDKFPNLVTEDYWAEDVVKSLIGEKKPDAKHNNDKLTLPGGTDYKELVVTVPTVEKYNESDTTHFGDTGQGKQIGWIRMNTRNGGLFIEELQSQRAQQGRSKGFNSRPPGKQFFVTHDLFYNIENEYGDIITKEDTYDIAAKRVKDFNENGLPRYLQDNNVAKGVPPAPFVSDANNKATNAYITLLMKKALIEAVSNDHSSVSWTTGDQQADRYDLSKQISRITYNKRDGKFTYNAYGVDGDNLVSMKMAATADVVRENLGKEILDKMINDEGHKTKHGMELSGLDLKVGGEWAQSMYGNEQGLNLQGKPSLMSQAANDIFKHVGSGKVESINGQPGFYITPEMKSKDLPLFSKATVTVDGVERPTTNSEGKPINNPVNFWRWFGDDANVDDQGRPKVLYHSTLEDVSEFSPTGKFMGYSGTSGISLTDNKDMASRYLDRFGERRYDGVMFQKNVMPVYAKIGKYIERNEPFKTDVRFGAPLPENYVPTHVNLGYDTVIRDDSINRKGATVKHSDAKNALRGKEYIVSSPNQIKSAIGNNGDYSSTDNDIRFSKAAPPPEETRFRRFQRMNQDSFNRFTVIKEWLAENGHTLSDKADVYAAEERYHSMAANKLEDFREQQRNPLIEKIQKAGYTLGDIEVFLKMQHAQEANAQIRKLGGDTAYGITDDEAADYLAEAPKDLAKLANEFRDITEQTKKLRLDAGILNTDITDAWEDAYQHYIPVKGEADATRGVGKGLKTNFKSKRRLGHGLRDEHVIENILLDHERAILEVERNRVGKHLVMMAAEMQRPDILSIDQPEKRKVLKTDIAYTVEVNGVIQGVFKSREEAKMFKQLMQGGLFEGTPTNTIVISQTKDQRVIASVSPMLADNEINVYMDGHVIRVQINDELLARAYTKLGVEQFSDIVAAGRILNGYLSKVYTGYNPEFILTNMIRDFSSGTINLTGEQGFGMATKALTNYPRMFGDLLKYAATNGKQSTKWIDSYRANGGNTGAAYLSDMERLGNEVSTEYASYQGVIANIKQGDTANAARAAGRKVFNATLKWIYNLNQAGENAMRLAAFKAMIESGRTVNEAAKVAKNITVNFNRKGERQWAPALYLFYNASIQGTAATAHALTKGKHRGQAWALAGSMAAVGYLVASAFGGGSEDDWDKINEYTKERNMLIKAGDGYVKVPVPYGYGFFWNLGRHMAEAQRTGEWGKLPWRLAKSAIEEFTPFGDVIAGMQEELRSDQLFMGFMPTALKIPAQPIFNKQLFSGNELMPESQFDKSQPDRQKMFRTTKGTMYDEVAGWLEHAGFDVSPETLKYATRTGTGGAGFFVDTSISAAMLKSEGADLDIQEMPFVRKFYMELGIKDKRAAYYKAREEARTAAEELNRARRDNDVGKMRAVVKDKREMLALDRYANKLAASIDAARDQQDEVRADKNLSVKEKRVKLKGMEAQEAKYYDHYLDVFKASKR